MREKAPACRHDKVRHPEPSRLCLLSYRYRRSSRSPPAANPAPWTPPPPTLRYDPGHWMGPALAGLAIRALGTRTIGAAATALRTPPAPTLPGERRLHLHLRARI